METNQISPLTIDDYIATFPPDVQAILQKVRMTIRDAAPEASETIKYGIPTFTLKGNLVHFGAYPKHIGFYPAPSGIERFRQEFSPYKNSKGAVQFPLDQPLPYDLISQVVRFRVAENLEKATTRKKGK